MESRCDLYFLGESADRSPSELSTLHHQLSGPAGAGQDNGYWGEHDEHGFGASEQVGSARRRAVRPWLSCMSFVMPSAGINSRVSVSYVMSAGRALQFKSAAARSCFLLFIAHSTCRSTKRSLVPELGTLSCPLPHSAMTDVGMSPQLDSAAGWTVRLRNPGSAACGRAVLESNACVLCCWLCAVD